MENRVEKSEPVSLPSFLNNEIKADQAIAAVIQSVIALNDARENNDTADFILREETKIGFAASLLAILHEDIKQANANSRQAAQ